MYEQEQTSGVGSWVHEGRAQEVEEHEESDRPVRERERDRDRLRLIRGSARRWIQHYSANSICALRSIDFGIWRLFYSTFIFVFSCSLALA